MIRNATLHHGIAAALIASLALAGCKRDAEEDTTAMTPPPMTTPAPLPPADPMPTATPTALNVTSITLGTAAGADNRITSPVASFGTGDNIIVSVATDGAASNATVAAKLLFQDGQVAGEESQAVNTTGPAITNITFTNANPWPTGTYRAEVSINGAMAQSAQFVVQ